MRQFNVNLRLGRSGPPLAVLSVIVVLVATRPNIPAPSLDLLKDIGIGLLGYLAHEGLETFQPGRRPPPADPSQAQDNPS